MDIKAAFLQGEELTRCVYIRPPQEAQSRGTLWTLKKCVDVLADASLYWYKRVTPCSSWELLSHKSNQLCSTGWSPCLSCGLLTLSAVVQKHSVIPHLKAAFEAGREEHSSFSYIGMEVHSLKDEMQVQKMV